MRFASIAGTFAVLFSSVPAVFAQSTDPALWLIVRPGMAVEDHITAWRERCDEFILSDDEGEENYLTCHMADGNVVTANIAPSGVAWWSRFWGAGNLPRAAFVAHFTTELGLSGDPSECHYFRDPAQCWNVGANLVTIPQTSQGDRWTLTMEDESILTPE